MQRATSPEFLAFPHGRYVVGRNWLCFSAKDLLRGTVLWGRIEGGDAEEIDRAVAATHRPEDGRHSVLVDLRRVENVDAAVFRIATAHLTEHVYLHDVIARFAIVRPDGFAGAVARGFFQIIAPPFETEVFTSIDEALSWLGAEGRPVVEEVEAVASSAGASASLVGRLRATIEPRLCDITIEAAASALGLSVRSLQRRLLQEHTSFGEELKWTRVRAAQRLLAQSDTTIAEIASVVGCGSQASLSVLFRRLVGESPRDWRARHREKLGVR